MFERVVRALFFCNHLPVYIMPRPCNAYVLLLRVSLIILVDANAGTIATTGGIKVVALAMANHPDENRVQVSAVKAIKHVVWNIPAHIAIANDSGLVPLLQHAATMGFEAATTQLKRMGV